MQFLHSMIRVKNEELAKKFYCDFLGLKVAKRVRLEDCYLQYLLDEKTGTEIELTINDELPENYSNGNAFGHFAFLCDDIEKEIQRAKDLGLTIDMEPIELPQVNSKIAFLLDFDRNSVELIQKL